MLCVDRRATSIAFFVTIFCCFCDRDPLVIFDGAVEEVDDATATEHFENIQSTNWQTVRWKPPPPREHEDSPRIGWR